MEYDEEADGTTITFTDAVEALSHIADMDLDKGGNGGAPIKMPSGFSAQLLHDRDAHTTIQVVKNSFKVILKYLQNFFQRESGYLLDQRTVEGIKNIMVLVGEAAKKLDRYTQILQGVHAPSVTDLKEYRQLQQFYQRRIARKIDDEVLGSWILQLTHPVAEGEIESEVKDKKVRAKRRVFIDLDAVKRDLEYELFYLRKEDGTRYYHPRLLRNIRLVSDFGEYFGDVKGGDVLEPIHLWRDRVFQATARDILHAVRSAMDGYFRNAARYKDKELVTWLNKTLTALILAANPHNLITHNPVKTCTDYFYDFQVFLRCVLTCRDYQKLVIYPPKKTNKIGSSLMDITHAICRGLYREVRSYQVLTGVFGELIDMVGHGDEELNVPSGTSGSWCNRLRQGYGAMTKKLRLHPNGILKRVLDVLENGGASSFDPLMQHNLPCRWYELQLGDICVSHVRMASPIRQEYIHKAVVNEEFREWLKFVDGEETVERHLLINLQDNTSWREHARCRAGEELQNRSPFDKQLTVVTLAVDTDFYHQNEPYHKVNQVDLFLKQFKEHLEGEGTGFYFPSSIRKAIFPDFIDGLLSAVHQLFFSGRNVLVHKDRLDFIELTYLLLIFKIIDCVSPDSFSLSCKDGVDTGSAFSALLFIALKIFNQERETPEDIESLQFLLYAPSLLIRERAMLPERFARFSNAASTLAATRDEMGSGRLLERLNELLGPLYKNRWWLSRAVFIRK